MEKWVNGPYLSIHEKNFVSHILGLKTEKKCFSDIQIEVIKISGKTGTFVMQQRHVQ